MDTDIPGLKPGYIPEPSTSPFKKPERQKGRWSFLTWSFFLSQVMATDFFFGRGAQAGQDEYDSVVAQPSSDTGSAFDDSPGAASAIAAIAEDIPLEDAALLLRDGHAASSVLPLQNVQAGGNTFGLKSQSNQAQAGASGGGGGTARSKPFKSDGEVAQSSKSDGDRLEQLDARDGASDVAVHATKTPDADSAVGSEPKLSPDRVASSPDEHGGRTPDSNGGVGAGPNLSPPHVVPDSDLVGIKPPFQIANDLAFELAPTVGLGGLDAQPLLGLEVQIGSEGLLLGADVNLGLPNPAHLLSDLGQVLGVMTSVNLSDILGFDIGLTADGTLVAADLSLLSHFSADPLLSDLTPIAGVSTEANLGHILGLDAQLGVASLLQAGLPGLAVSDTEGALPQAITTTLAEVTGLQLFAPSGSLTAALANESGLDHTDSLTKPIELLISSQQGEPGAHVLSELNDLATLKQSGDVTSGDSINFSVEKLGQLNELFNGNSYTDYHVTLQSQNSDLPKITETLKSDTLDHAEASLVDDTSTDSQDAASALATTIELATPAAEASVVNISVAIPSISLEELSERALSI
jgi:hypothetical protein